MVSAQLTDFDGHMVREGEFAEFFFELVPGGVVMNSTTMNFDRPSDRTGIIWYLDVYDAENNTMMFHIPLERAVAIRESDTVVVERHGATVELSPA